MNSEVDPFSTYDEIKTRSLKIVDGQNRVRIGLEASDDSSLITLFGSDSNAMIKLAVKESENEEEGDPSASVELYDVGGNLRVGIDVQHDATGQVSLYSDAGGDPVATMTVIRSQDEHGLSIELPAVSVAGIGRSAIDISRDADTGSVSLNLYDALGNARIIVAMEEGRASMMLADAMGDIKAGIEISPTGEVTTDGIETVEFVNQS